MIDGSGSIAPDNFQILLEFVNQTASLFEINPDRIRTGLMIYDETTYLRSLFNEHQSNQDFSKIVMSTRYPRGNLFLIVINNNKINNNQCPSKIARCINQDFCLELQFLF